MLSRGEVIRLLFFRERIKIVALHRMKRGSIIFGNRNEIANF